MLIRKTRAGGLRALAMVALAGVLGCSKAPRSQGPTAQADSLRRANPETAPPDDPEFVYVEELPGVISRIPPVDPEASGRVGADTVFVRIRIDRDGRVREATAVQSNPALEKAALAAVKQWRFRPARSNNRPIASWITIPVCFEVQDSRPAALGR